MRVKTVISIFLVSILLGVFLSTNTTAYASDLPLIYVDSDITNISLKEEVNITIAILNAIGVSAWEFKLTIDPSILYPVNVTKGDFLERHGDTYLAWYWGGTYIQAGAFLLDPVVASGNGTLAVITFVVLKGGDCVLHLYETKLYDIDLQSINHTREDGYFSFNHVTLRVEPETISVKSQGNWITAYIEPHNYDVYSVDFSSIRLTIRKRNVYESFLPAKLDIQDTDNDSFLELVVKFDRKEVIDFLNFLQRRITLTLPYVYCIASLTVDSNVFSTQYQRITVKY